MSELFERHRALLGDALDAIRARGHWSPFPEVPSRKLYGETAAEEGESAFAALSRSAFDLPGHPEARRVGREVSPFGAELSISYPAADAEALIAASRGASPVWAAASIEDRVGVCLEILTRLHAMSFLMGHATMQTTGQGFAMAFQAGGPHALDRGLEAVATAYDEMARVPAKAIWEKPQGRGEPIRLEKHWRIVPRGVSLVIACQTFPTWNSYPAIFASLATGNTVIVKPHPGAILPLALTVRVAREVLVEAGFSPDVVLLAADELGAEITSELVRHPATAIIDYTGSSAFAGWIRDNAHGAAIFTEETGVNSIVVAGTDDFAGMCANIAFSLSLYSGQMCTAPQDIFVPRRGIRTNEGHKSFEELGEGIALAIDALLADPKQAAGIAGAIANPATRQRVEQARAAGRIVRDDAKGGPLLLAVEDGAAGAHEEECFGPVAFLIPVEDGDAGIARAAELARTKGAITGALYDTDEERIARAIDALLGAGVNLSINLTGGIFVNQSAAFSDFHVTGANPAGNASLTDTAFVSGRFRRAMWRRPVAPDT
ncbi:phenylacetic acid degradation protein PaaN [Consotaella salsifontis]|uniref:Phenylacetic acid degradation protein paaN n=1 Tax=Consotaella salsifontis TaxID=1365950 RepID=A0A1T4PLN7_9HYPH|nr:phenylacetic acid degradation protein PaaN [Consotaella salsifontis]SJZ92504.1 phenylacetic acid degradation protein paaN [Consotaella salsifontis]